MLNLKGYLQPDACRTLSEENREYRPKQRMNVGRMERIWWLERGFGKMSKRPKPFEYKGKKKTRLPRESLWRDGLSFSKWWRRRESNPRPKPPWPGVYARSLRLEFGDEDRLETHPSKRLVTQGSVLRSVTVPVGRAGFGTSGLANHRRGFQGTLTTGYAARA